MNIWPLLLILASSCAFAQQEQAPDPREDNAPPVNWLDSSHAYATDGAQTLTRWMDDFFGDPTYILEQAESFLRLELIDDWDGEDGHNLKARLRGKVQLPKISSRLNLVFSGEESEHLDEEDRRVEDTVGVQYKLSEGSRSRFDLTMGFSSSHLKPGVRYRNEGRISEHSNYRFTERLQYEDGEGFFTISQLDLNRATSSDALWRWSNRALWGEHTDGVEWRSKMSYRQLIGDDLERPTVLSYFGTINGVTRPEQYTRNYKLGLILRRRVYREYLFLELEPAYNYRRREYEDSREGMWSMVVRLEIALERDLRRIRRSAADPAAS